MNAKKNIRKTKKALALALGLSTLSAVPALAGWHVGINVGVPAPVVVAPAPPVVVAPVPDSYVWDGDEYVGMVGDSYYYLGPDNVWLALDGPRQARWHDWEHHHADWHDHMVHNDRFRGPAHIHDEGHHDSHRDHDWSHGHH